jgi:sulfate adenylyltransferase
MIEPHGGKLINQMATDRECRRLLSRSRLLPKIVLHADELIELDNIAVGLYSPLKGFMTKNEYRSVVRTMRLPSGDIWPIPIVLGVDPQEAKNLRRGDEVLLIGEDEMAYAVLELRDLYQVNKDDEIQQVFGTQDKKHPGVNQVMSRGELLLGGTIRLLQRPRFEDMVEYRRTPAQTRELFDKNGWGTIVGFQTRNPIHRAHEYIQKCALEIVDALFLNPLVGWTTSSDLSAETRMASYRVMLERYFPQDRVLLGVFSAAMRYAGPREAVFHALCRKNFGCTHFIVGRDHAGIGNYYGTYDAQLIFTQFKPREIGITPLCFEHTFYCRACAGMASSKTCPHSSSEHITLSGTMVREMLRRGEAPPPEFTRPEVADVLTNAMAEPIELERV